ncbi:MAG TPA: mannose-1-phosphate guanylyltransferase/mannose-6-phosphate isomerase [Burkholderiales bacterium]|nr:mannose-1-phosphate guanylyltransferase/mannose-6-phosphate isomerase [Burkholderiales bacterium]
MMIYPVILCGGAGSRLWPLSRALLPKQFLPLVSERTMLQETVQRLAGAEALTAPLVISNAEHRFLVAEQLRDIDVQAHTHVLEPVGRNTAPAVAAAALCVTAADPEGTLLVLPADHLIKDIARFHNAIREAAAIAHQGKLVTFGIRPSGPVTGYGYIKRGARLKEAQNTYAVAEFIEKPDLERARQLVAAGGYDWNSGMFVFRARRYLDELGRWRPDILAATREALDKGVRDLDFRRLEEAAFGACPSDSIDYAVMEKTRDAAMVAADFDWSDIGSWEALWAMQAKDVAGNVQRGDVYLDRANGCYVRAESRLVAAVGVKNLVIVETDDAVLVTDKEAAHSVKDTVEHLKANRREEPVSHSRVYRPWGYYESLDSGAGFQVKRIMVKPGARLSLQMHHKRAEHWVVVSGIAAVTRGEETFILRENQSTYIPLGVKHRLENPGEQPLHVIEVQSGTYLGEDDIVRFADDYKRA